MTSVAYFCLGSFVQSKKTESIVNNLKIENQSLKEQIENYNSIQYDKKELNNDTPETIKHPIDIEEEKCIASSNV